MKLTPQQEEKIAIRRMLRPDTSLSDLQWSVMTPQQRRWDTIKEVIGGLVLAFMIYFALVLLFVV